MALVVLEVFKNLQECMRNSYILITIAREKNDDLINPKNRNSFYDLHTP